MNLKANTPNEYEQSGVKHQQHGSAEFLLAEYQHFADSFWRNEELGERRVNFFILLATAVISALAALEKIDFENTSLLTAFALLALLSIGVVTLQRMLRRNRVTDEYKEALKKIRGYLKEPDPRLETYQPLDGVSEPRKSKTGGLVDLVAVMNSIIVAAFCALFLSRLCSGPGAELVSIALFVSTGFVVWFAQEKYIAYYGSRKSDTPKGD
jgi:hypothetical protein